MKKKESNPKQVTKKSLLYWAFTGNTKLQLLLLVIVIGVVFARVIPLEMQKRIINDSIINSKFDQLVLYCLIYLFAVVTASGLKLAINYLQAVIGERAMVAMREDLYHHILTLPLSFFRTTQPGMVVSSLMTELTAAGSFAGMALAVPLTNILTLLAFSVYLLWLNTKLALATLAIYPFVVFLVPILQKKSNVSNRQRVDVSREVASQIAESVTGISEVQVHGAYAQEGQRYNKLVQHLQKIRVRWSLLKFGIKTTNNFFVSLGPFVVFLFGGYLVMQGQLELGAMVAFLSAQEKLYDPWKELIDCYQVYQDAKVRYSRTMGHFDVTPEFLPSGLDDDAVPLTGKVDVQNLVFTTKEGITLLDGVSFSLKAGEHLAVVGFSGSGKSTLIKCIGQMYKYSSGSVLLDGNEVLDLTKKDVVGSVGFISQMPFIFTGTIQENLLYAAEAASYKVILEEGALDSRVSGLDKMIMALQQAGLFVDVMRFGLDSVIDSFDQTMIEKIVRMREEFQQNFGESLKDCVEFYDENKYLHYSTVAENITFGSCKKKSFAPDKFSTNNAFQDFLDEMGLTSILLELGVDITKQTVELLAGLDSVDLVSKYIPVPINKFDDCAPLLQRVESAGVAALKKEDKYFLISMALGYSPGIHKTVALSEELEQKIMQSRVAWGDGSRQGEGSEFVRYKLTDYIYGESILNNVFFGRVKTDLPQAQDKINKAIIHLLIEEDCLEDVARIGMDFEVGSMGDKLSGGQRQKLAIARVLLKQPRMVIMDEATSALDNKSQSRIQKLIETRWQGKRTVISVVHRLDSIKNFDKVAVMKSGKIMEIGTYNELIDKKGGLYELVYGKQQ